MEAEIRPSDVELRKNEQVEAITSEQRELGQNTQELSETPVNHDLPEIVDQSTQILSSPEGEASAVVEGTLEEFDHAQASNDKAEEALVLEHLLADTGNEILSGDIASKIQDDAIEIGEIKAIQ